MQQDWIKQVKKERKKLNKKLTKLVEFLESDEASNLSTDMYNLLQVQTTIMAAYVNILNTRLDYIDS